MKQIIDFLQENGWQEDGKTREETVRIPTVKSPVFGDCGGKVVAFGGRLRFFKNNWKG